MVEIIALSSVDESQATQVGGKAANLGRLLTGGFQVPPGVVVPVEAYDDFLEQNKLKPRIEELLKGIDFEDEASLEKSSQAIKSLFTKKGDAKYFKALDEAIEAIDPDGIWSVRSSAVAEDLASASFAGQQDTYLNVRRENVPERVRECWASYWNSRAIAYRHKANVPQSATGIAVVVQRMVDARSSGIMFTTDPVSGKKDRIIIESSWGLGESIASGMVTPDRFVCDKGRLAVMERTINRKFTGIFLSLDGSKSVKIDDEDQTAPSLTTDMIKAVAKEGKRIEAFFGSPQDVEWALEGDDVYILQSRPVTTLIDDGETLWTRAYGDEYWSDVVSPLFFSLLGEMLTKYVNHEGSEIMGYKNLTGKELLRVHKGHIYFNASVLEEVFTYNPKFSRTKELLNYFPQKDQDRIARADTKIVQRLTAEIRIGILDYDGTIIRTDKAYNKWAASFMKEATRFDALDLKNLKDAELWEEYMRLREAGIKHFQLIRYGMVTHSIGMNLMLRRWLMDWINDQSGYYYSKLISGLEDNKTIKTNIAMAKLARSVQKDRKAREILASESSREIVRRLNTDPKLKDFNDQLRFFLSDYGHRSHTREMFYPRWADDPGLVIDVIKALIASEIGDLEKLEKDKIWERKATEREVLEKLGHLRNGFVKKILFRVILNFAQTYLMFRENQRFYLDHMIYRWRVLFMEFGRRYAERGVLEKQSDIFFLSKEEISQMVDGTLKDVKGLVAERREEFDRYANILPPKFLRGKVEFDDTVVRDADTVKVVGVSASPGVVTGKIRVVETIESLPSVQQGEIMVTSNTDPGWTAVFSKLGGLITEAGGILSHGAVVSREYGIPAVTAVKDAATFFHTGQKVTLDGNDGTIYILKEE
jgi:pyruvate,water dikinase